ncbi:hypothetical protein KC332_g11659 [Hortaea werneckii]|uniref:F-box domain-containing protein n=2 Tax=Hortaea werneckii TaxID=91943 RepID=A0A3M7I3J0_HORWE|nr:hypothetical protein KC350_g13046 [Hortaea werneckii]KAI6818719.1 hypothetical protein KC358_g9959 [Hortaea werneckii]KAI6907815.1 hypothetical protein KC348_g14097 [Hortaea werneckii]KAI6924272.1 hypothetical protein KC341_g14161 [Hortaea werneckii]KAI6958377.1 hypothetical protein KC321_g14029 [Hortaea werneckii]
MWARGISSQVEYYRTRTGEDVLMAVRPTKQKYVRFQITSDDIDLQTTHQPATVPESAPSQRHTWPEIAKHPKAGRYPFETVPTLVRTPWESERSAFRSQFLREPRPRSPQLPRRIFERLPREVYQAILDQLESLYIHGNSVDVIGRQTDLKALSLVDKRWHRIAREHLYREIWVPSDDDRRRRSSLLFRRRSRLYLLRRTLKASQALASMVRRLHITSGIAIDLDSETGHAARRRAAYIALTSVVELCPNLEQLSGYNWLDQGASSAGLLEALARCSGLKQHVWVCGSENVPNPGLGVMLECHSSWAQLETLVLCSNGELRLGTGSISALVQRLPQLQHLMLSGLDRHDFHNGTLLCSPPVKSLRLENLEGVSNQGIEQLSISRLCMTFEKLSLIGLELTSLRTLQSLIANAVHLRHFTLVQDTSPEFQPGMESANSLKGFESKTLEYLHWDALIPGSGTTLVANSIASGRLPVLRRIKVPCDYEGAIQSLCRPIACERLTSGDMELLVHFSGKGRYERVLRIAQIQAQRRIRECRRQPSFNVVVQDEDQTVSAQHMIGSFIGNVDSKIEYSLEPGAEGSRSGLVQLQDVMVPERPYDGSERKTDMEKGVKEERLLDLKMLF